MVRVVAGLAILTAILVPVGLSPLETRVKIITLVLIGIPGLAYIYDMWRNRKLKTKEGWLSKGKRDSRAYGYQFEEVCAKYLRKKGFRNVVVTPASNDFGADITAEKNGEKWVFQCKYYKKPVPNDAVQEVLGSKKHYGATRAGVLTNSKLSKGARILAFENQVEIWECLRDW